jgi:hypothetical protein
MSRKTTSIPSIRVTPDTKALIESVLREGESLSQFVLSAARQEAEWRQLDAAFATRRGAAMTPEAPEGPGGDRFGGGHHAP